MGDEYRFVGETTEVFPAAPIGRELAPGDTFTGPAGIIHPRLERKDGETWVATLTDPETPHEPAPADHAPVVPAETAQDGQDGAPSPGDGESPTTPPSGPPAPSERASQPKGH